MQAAFDRARSVEAATPTGTDCSEMQEKPEYVWLSEARRFLSAGAVLCVSEEYRRGRFLLTPTLHVMAHGIELFLKAALIRNGATATKARAFGHDILGLWSDPRNQPTRADVLTAAAEIWQDPRWVDDVGKPSEPPVEEYLRSLSELHGKKFDYAPRYGSGRTPEMVAPKPYLLLATFDCVSIRYVNEMNERPG